MTASELWATKWPGVRRLVYGQCKRWCVPWQDRHDVAQTAAFELWKVCQRAAEQGHDVSVWWVFKAAFYEVRRDWRRHRPTRALGKLRDDGDTKHEPIELIADPRLEPIRAPGCGTHVTRLDVRLDHPEAMATLEHGIDAREAARRLGVCSQAVFKRTQQLGGLKFPGLGWLFPPELGLDSGETQHSPHHQADYRNDDQPDDEHADSKRQRRPADDEVDQGLGQVAQKLEKAPNRVHANSVPRRRERECGSCGRPMRKVNRYGFCNRTRACKRQYDSARYQEGRPAARQWAPPDLAGIRQRGGLELAPLQRVRDPYFGLVPVRLTEIEPRARV